jgi:hypothetical protein
MIVGCLLRVQLLAIATFTLAVVLGSSVTAAQTTFYNNFGPSYSFDQANGWGICGSPACPLGISVAMPFRSAATGAVSQIDFAGYWIRGVNAVNVSLWTNDNGIPGTQIGSNWIVQNLPTMNDNSIVTISNIARVALSQGSSYLPWIQAADPSSGLGWHWTFDHEIGTISQNVGGTWTVSRGYLSAFDVLGGITMCKGDPKIGRVDFSPFHALLSNVQDVKKDGTVYHYEMESQDSNDPPNCIYDGYVSEIVNTDLTDDTCPYPPLINFRSDIEVQHAQEQSNFVSWIPDILAAPRNPHPDQPGCDVDAVQQLTWHGTDGRVVPLPTNNHHHFTIVINSQFLGTIITTSFDTPNTTFYECDPSCF